MSFSNDQVAESLLAYYKSRGLDMTGLLSDPAFHSLPVKDRLAFVQRNAADIASGVNTGPSPQERINLLDDIMTVAHPAILGALSGTAATRYQGKVLDMLKDPSFYKAVGGNLGIAAGAAVLTGIIINKLRADNSRAHRQLLKNSLETVASTGSLPEAAGALSGAMRHQASNPYVDFIKRKIDGVVQENLPTLKAGNQQAFEDLIDIRRAKAAGAPKTK